MNTSLPHTIAEMYLRACETHSDRVVLTFRPDHPFAEVTFRDLHESAARLASGLLSLGIKKGDRVLVMSENRPEWVISDFALACIGAVSVPVHSVLSSEQVLEIVEESQPKAAIVSGAHTFARLYGAYDRHMASAPVVSLDDGVTGAQPFASLIGSDAEPADLRGLAATVTPADLASITFTSGTTGRQKGVMLTHMNLTMNTYAGMKAIPYSPEDRFVSVLPLSHVFERVAGLYAVIASGASLRQIESADGFLAAAKESRPTMLVAVPRLFEKVQEIATEQAAGSPVRRRVFSWAFDERISRLPIVSGLFNRLVYSRIRHVFGDELRCVIIGGAKLPLSVSAFFDTVGIPLLEGYGLTETSPIVATNTVQHNRYGTVGRPLDGVSVRFADDGEVLVSGDTVMLGYVREEDTAESMTPDGWLRTGDLGSFDEAGHLVLTGRKKDILVLTTGKKVAPTGIEEALLGSPFIQQACVLGDGRKHVCAIIVPNNDAVARRFGEITDACCNVGGRVHEHLAAEVERATAHLSSIERVRAFAIAQEPFTQDNGLLTPTLKMKRMDIAARYEAEVVRLYA